MRKNIRFLRYTLQVLSLTSFVTLFATLSYPLGIKGTLLQLSSWLDPWLLFSWLRWQQQLSPYFLLSAVTIVVTLLWGRVFCGWFCPLGALLTAIDTLSRKFLKNHRMILIRQKSLNLVQPIRPYWLLLLSLVFLLGSNILLFFTPFALFTHELMRLLSVSVPWLLLGLIFSTIFFSRIWCSILCPTGALLSFIAKGRLYGYKPKTLCITCGRCSQCCPVGARITKDSISEDWCVACGDCQHSCKLNQISWQRLETTEIKPDFRGLVSRRHFFKISATAAIAITFLKTTVYAASKVLRPPGALPEQEFTALCNRCGKCIQACPSQALEPMDLEKGLINFQTPHIIARQKRCDLCLVCQEICPTGAITKVPLPKINMGKATLNQNRCLAWQENKLCFICGEQCPTGAVKGDKWHRPTVLTEKCVGCGACENACPIQGAAAIWVEPR